MVADLRPRLLALTINGTDYSDFVSQDGIVVNFASWASNGLIVKEGVINLVAQTTASLSLDPRDNSDFRPGRSVNIQWDGSTHPVAGNLLVIEYPSVGVKLPGLPYYKENLTLSIPVGCRLAYHLTVDPDDDESGVDLGVDTSGAIVCRNLLNAAGISSGDISLGGFANDFNYPIQKNGGQWVRQAAEVAYSARSNSGPGYLYCDSSNTVRSAVLNTRASSTITITLGTDDRDYVYQPDTAPPPRVVQAVGILREVQVREACELIVRNIGDTETVIQFCQLSPLEVFLSLPATELQISFIAPKGTVKEIDVQVDGSQSSEEREYKGFGNSGNLVVFILTQRKRKEEISSASVDEDGDDFVYFFVRDTRYFRDPQGILIRREIREYTSRILVNPAETEDPFVKVQSLEEITFWSFTGQYSTEDVVRKRSRILVDPTATEDVYDLVADSDNTGATVSITGEATPVRTESCEPLEFVQETQLSVEQEFNDSQKRRIIQVPYAFSEAQLKAIALDEGRVDWGRQQSYLIESQPDLFSARTSPLPTIKVVERDISRIYLLDALTWQLTATQDYVGGVGIFLGNTTGTEVEGGGLDRPLIAPTNNIEFEEGLTRVGVLFESMVF